MANPVQRDALIEIAFGADLTADPRTWSWADVSADLLAQDISINRGRADESSETQPMATSLTLDNISGDYTPDNPVGAYYPNVRRGTPLRINIPGGESYFAAGDPDTAVVSTPDAAALDVTGDIDIRVDFRASILDPFSVTFVDLFGKFVTAGDQRSWRVSLADGVMSFQWYSAGTLASVLSAQPTTTPHFKERAAYRITLDVNNGAGGWTVTFYRAPSIDGPWEQFGNPVTGVGVTSIFSGTAPVELGDFGATAFPGLDAKIWAAQIYNGINGTLVADADFRDLDPGTTAFTDSVGRTWTVGGGGEITDVSQRFIGQVDAWEPTWPAGDVTGDEPPHAVTEVTASSVRRRLIQGQSPIDGPIQRAVLATPNVFGYWPMEDGTDATSIASGLPSGPAMTFTGSPNLAASDVFLASTALPEMNGAQFTGQVLPHTATGTVRAQCLLYAPDAFDNGVIMRVFTTGTAARWDLSYAGGLALSAYDGLGVLLFTQGVGFAVEGEILTAIITMVQNGANVDWEIRTLDNGTGAAQAFGLTLNAHTIGRATSIQINPGGVMTTEVIGHVLVTAAIPGADFQKAMRGYIGENAIDRFIRLCGEEDLQQSVIGGRGPSEAMGEQLPGVLLEALQQCADSDAGILLDRMDIPGLLFRPRATLYRQEPDLILDAAVNGIANPFAPVLDDQRIRNDVTVIRVGGSSARATDETSIDAEGLYDDSITLSLFTDDQTVGQANWRLHLGTVPGMRYATITVDFDTAPTDILRTWLSDLIDVGDLIRIRSLPRQHAPDDVDLIVQGYTENISQSRWQVTFNCSPGSPYRVGIYDGVGTRESRYASGGTTLAEDLDATETSIDITTPSGPVWTTDPGQYPLDIVIGGERITAGGCTGTGPAQTFTGCTRSVNGVVKTHTTGAEADLFTPTYYAL